MKIAIEPQTTIVKQWGSDLEPVSGWDIIELAPGQEAQLKMLAGVPNSEIHFDGKAFTQVRVPRTDRLGPEKTALRNVMQGDVSAGHLSPSFAAALTELLNKL